MLNLNTPVKRDQVLYTRISKANKEFVKRLAKREDVSEALVVDSILGKYRQENAGNKKKPIKRT